MVCSKSRFIGVPLVLSLAAAWAILCPERARAAEMTWTGATNAWGDGSNWSGMNLPISGDFLVFGSARADGLYLDNNLTNDSFNIAGITFNSGAETFIIGNGTRTANVGNPFVLTGPVTNNSTALQTINNPFSMAAARMFTTTVGGGDIKLGGTISGTFGGIAKAGAGTLTLSGNNTFGGGVTLIAGTLKIDSSAALGTGTFDIGAAGGTAVTLDALSARTITNAVNINQGFTCIGTNTLTQNTGAVTLVNGTHAIAVSANTLAIGGAIGDGGGSYGLTKLGPGTLILNGSAASTFTGGLSIYAGALELNFNNLGTPTDLINRGNALTLGSGTLRFIGKTGDYSTSQSFAGLTITGGARVLVNPKGGAGTTVPLGSIATVNAIGRSLLVGKPAGAGSGTAIITTTDNKDGRGIYGGRVVYTSNGGDIADWATTKSASSPYALDAYGDYTTMVTGTASDSSNAITGSLVIAGDHTHNTLKLTGGATLALGANTLTLASGGLLSTGPGASTISGAAGDNRLTGGNNGSGKCDLIIHQYNADGLTISAVIGDNGTNPTALTKAGPGTLALTGQNSYTGDTIILAGTLSIGNGSNGSSNLADASTVKISVDAKMNLNFSGYDQIADLWLGSVHLPAGTYDGSIRTSSDYRSYFTGSGSLLVVPSALLCDADSNGVVAAADFITLKKSLSQGTTLGAAAGDFNGDKQVNWADLQLLAGNMGPGGSDAAATPEPCSAMLLVFGALAVLRRPRPCLHP